MSGKNDRRMPGTGALLAIAAALALVGASGIVFWWKMAARVPADTAAPALKEGASGRALADEFLTATLSVPSGDALRAATARLPRRADARSQAFEVATSLLSDAHPDRGPVLSNVSVRELYLDASGTAYLDLSLSQQAGIRSSAWEELVAVYALVNSISQNVEEIKRVRILIDGKTAQTLAGHIDLGRTFTMRQDLVKQ